MYIFLAVLCQSNKTKDFFAFGQGTDFLSLTLEGLEYRDKNMPSIALLVWVARHLLEH